MNVLFVLCGFLPTTWLSYWTPTTLLLSTDLACNWTSTAPLTPTDHRLLNFVISFVVIWSSLRMATRKCCVRNCNKTCADISLHKFPHPVRDSTRFKCWIESVGNDMLFIDEITVFKQYRICHSHFETKYHSCNGRLTRNAIPTLSLPVNQIFSREPLQEITNRTYSRQSRQSINQEFEMDLCTSGSTSELSQQLPSAMALEPVASTSLSSGQLPLLKPKRKQKYMTSAEVVLGSKIRKLQKSKESTMARLKKALKLKENPTFQKALKNFSSASIIFTMLQFREARKNKLGRRFNKNEKILALALYKQGPRAYRWLRNFFVLPSPLTLSRMLSRASLKPGVNENLFKQLQKRVAKMSTTERLCVLLFDEIALMPHFDYIKRSDNICGFVNNGTITKQEIADHALVFMIRGIQRNYKQPVGYSFCASTTPSIELVLQIKTMIRKLHSIGFKVIATICDQGATNVSAINYLINETRQEHLREGNEIRNKNFKIDGEVVVPLYDVPHLIKGVRNNLLSKNLKATINGQDKVAKWEHILLLYKENPSYEGIRLMPKLTDRHVIPHKISKMKVKCATQVFSKCVASNMGYLASEKVGILPPECKDTADILIFFDNLFDSLNGSFDNYNKRKGKPLLAAVTPKSNHKQVWKDAKNILKSMKFIDSNKKLASVPTLKNWHQTIENIEYIIDILWNKYSLTSIWMRHFNQDPLENFFGSVRSHGYRNNNPTCAVFEAAFASLLINNLSSVHSPGSNCEADTCSDTAFSTLKKLFFCKTVVSSCTVELKYEDIDSDHIFIDVDTKRANAKIRAQLEYVTGYVLKKLRVIKCNICKSNLYDTSDDNVIYMREYFENKRLLMYPSYSMIKCFSNLQDVVTTILRNDPKKLNIKQYIKTVFSVVIDYDFLRCKEHKRENIEKIEDVSVNLFIYNWCKDTNKILSGCRTDYDLNSPVQSLAYNYCKKRIKK